MKTITVNNVEYVEKKEYEALSKKKPPAKLPTISKNDAPYQVGANYFIRTVTHYFTGKLVWVGDKELVLENPAWIADSGRWMQAVQNGTLKEVEPMNEQVVIGRGAIIDASVVEWDLPVAQK